jgi:transposase
MELSTSIDFQSLNILYEKEKKEKEELKAEVLKLQLHLQKLVQMMYGGKSERFIPNPAQLTLGIIAETPAASTDLSKAKKIEYIKTGESKKRDVPELQTYMQYLPHEYETIEPDDIREGAEKIGEDRHESLEYIAGRTFVKVTILPKYKLLPQTVSEDTKIISASAPERPLAKCLAGSSLLAQILVDKFCDHLPLHRQQKRFERNGVMIPYNTFIEWSGKAIDLISVFGPALLKEIIDSSYIHVDETGLKVLLGKETGKVKKIHDGYLWCYHNSIHKLVYFDYQAGRGEKHTIGILKNFHGIIQTDGWRVYEGVAAKQKDITQICCLAHARRKFFESKTYDEELAAYALTRFNSLYEIERNCKEKHLSFDEIKNVRQRQSVPILNELHQWMITQYKVLLPSSPVRIAIAYSLERWDRLCYYTTDGMLNPDNNPVERNIRPVALGRKNFLFAGSHKGAERLALIYSLMGTCKMNDVNPYEWLKDVLDKINGWPINRINELLPHKWKLAKESGLS